MGQLCCKNPKFYVRQQDENESEMEVMNALGVPNPELRPPQQSGQQSGPPEGGNNRSRPFVPRPSEDSTKGSETELDGGFYPNADPYINSHYKRTTTDGRAPTTLARRLRRRLTHWRRDRNDDNDLEPIRASSIRRPVHSSKGKDAGATQWATSPDAVFTKGHQGFKEQKKGADNNNNQSTDTSKCHKGDVQHDHEWVEQDHEDKDQADEWEPCNASSSSRPHTIESLPYAVEYSPIAGKFPAPASRAGSPSRRQVTPVTPPGEPPMKRRRFTFRRQVQQQEAETQQPSERPQLRQQLSGPLTDVELSRDVGAMMREDFGRVACPPAFPFDEPSKPFPEPSQNKEHAGPQNRQNGALTGADQEMTSLPEQSKENKRDGH